MPRQIDSARIANDPRIQRSEYSSTSFRRRTSSSTATRSTTLTAIATSWTRSITFEPPDVGTERHDDHREQKPGTGCGHTERRQRRASPLPRPRLDRHFDNAQVVALQK